MHIDVIEQHNERLKIIYRRMQWLRKQPREKGYAWAEHDALRWVVEDLLPAWIKQQGPIQS